MRQRLIVAAVGIPALLAILLLAPPWATAALTCFLSGVGCYELIHAVGGERRRLFIGLPVLSAAQTAAFSYYPHSISLLGSLALVVVVYSFGIAIFCWGTDKKVCFSQTMAGIFGALAISASFAALALMRQTSAAMALTPLIAAFASDSGAFFAGRAFGKRKLAPAVSPNKTVAGCIGGFAGSILGMAVFHLVVKYTIRMDLGWPLILLLGVLGSFMGQLGDLSFSVIKREFGIKDYGKLFPGHGGVLDRFDSVIFVAPAFWMCLRLAFG